MSTRNYHGILMLFAFLVSSCSDTVTPIPQPPLDSKAVEANNHAVGLMGQFEYAQARALFTDIVDTRPAWNEAKVNLAIATLNRQQDGDETLALEIVKDVLQSEPQNLRARYIAGLVHLFLGAPQDALPEFRYVTDADPQDAHAAYYLGQCLAQLSDYDQALTWYRQAMDLDPYLRSAYYGAFQSLQRLGQAEEAGLLAADFQRLENNPRSQLAEFKYTRMGPKAEARAIGLTTEPASSPPGGALFAKSVPLAVENPDSLRWHKSPGSQATSLTTVDMQNDGWHDIFLTGVTEVLNENDETLTGNLVLKGQPNGVYSVIPGHPLMSVAGVNAALWGDFDNDGMVDVYLCRRGSNQLWRQVSSDSWQDVTASTATAGADLNTVDGAFFDADHDGDLDLFLVNADGHNELLNNNLDGTFRPLAEQFQLTGSNAVSTMVLPVDLDNDRDADLIVLNQTPPHQVYINDRLWSYHAGKNFVAFNQQPALAVMAADIDADGQTELYTVNPEGELLAWRAEKDGQFQSNSLAIPDILKNVGGKNVRQAQLATSDINGDGRPDLIISSERGWSVLSITANTAEPLYTVLAPEAAPIDASLPFIGTSQNGPGMLVFSAKNDDLSLWQPGPGRYPFVTLSLSGRQDDAQSMRSNASGIGAQLALRSGSRWSILQTYRNHSAPGQSLQPQAVGLKGARQADFISVEWSDGVFQSEVSVQAGQLHRITETQRQLSSCPVLFAWNGKEYVFVSDILGVGGLGYSIAPGQYSTPRPWENFLLPDGLLKTKNDRYELKITEPMEENAYLDAARLAIYDLPPGWKMVMDERLGISAPEPTGEPRFYRRELLPVAATNDRGQDVLNAILIQDGLAAPVGSLDLRFIGRLKNEHVLNLEFSQTLESDSSTLVLLIDGWVEYPYSQTNFAAWQAGAAYEAPTLEAFANGKWHIVTEQFGYPAGMPRRMSLPMENLPSGSEKLRLRTNMQVYWDRIAIVFAEELPDHQKQLSPVASATLAKTGFARRTNLNQFRPQYDYANLDPFWDTRYMAGNYTRLGPVEELVTTIDDAVAIIGPGEEIHLEFEAVNPAPANWHRFIVLETNGWAKDMDLFTRDGESVGPLPSTGKPPGIRDQLHTRYNTRYQSGY